MKTLTLLQKLLLLCGFAVLTTAVLGTSAVRSLSTVAEDATRITQMAAAQRAQMDADMMHDGIRADVLLVNLGAARGDAEMHREGLNGLREHTARLRENMKLAGADPDANIQKAVRERFRRGQAG